nr:serine protease [uncultured Rhodopila sp.]
MIQTVFVDMAILRRYALLLGCALSAEILCTVPAGHAEGGNADFQPDGRYPLVSEYGPTSPFKIAAMSVGRLSYVLRHDSVPHVVCAATVVAPDLLLTARHCFRDKDDNPRPLESAEILLGHLSKGSGIAIQVETTPVQEGQTLDDDYMLLRTSQDIPPEFPIAPLSASTVSSGEDLFVVHAPQGSIGLLSISGQCRAARDPERGWFLRHTCVTERGSSGAPVFLLNGKMVGVHTNGNPSTAPDSAEQAVSVRHILSVSPFLQKAFSEQTHARPSVTPGAGGNAQFKMGSGDGGLSLEQYNDFWILRSQRDGEMRTKRLILQCGGGEMFVLWDTVGDTLYRVPRSGGRLQYSESATGMWKDFGNADLRPLD